MDKAVEDDARDKEDDFKPRNYQVALMEVAIKKNSILYLPTGSGKTFIAVLVLKALSHELNKKYSEGGKISFILVNTVALVDQHARCIEQRTNLNVGRYSGEMNLDLWPKSKWYNEFDLHQVFVMTVQILTNISNQYFIDLNKVNLLVFDECHRGVNDHSMRQLCKNFENLREPPRVLGLTATLLNGNVKPSKITEKVEELEVTYHAQVATVDGLQDVIGYSTNPQEEIVVVEAHRTSSVENLVIAHLNELCEIVMGVKDPTITGSRGYSDLTPLEQQTGLKKLANSIKDVIFLIETLGVYGGTKGIIAHLIQIERLRKHCDDVTLCKVLNCVGSNLNYVLELFNKAMLGYTESEKIRKFSSHKVRKLFQIFDDYKRRSNQQLCALIFTKRRFTAKVLYYVLDSLSKADVDYSYIKPNFIVGNNNNPYNDTREALFSSKKNKQILQSFDHKEINVLVASNVLEEGVDITTCSLVVKFEHPEEYRSYIQSKGRARNRSSLYYMIVEQPDRVKFCERYLEYKKVEETLNELLIGRNEERSEPAQELIENMYGENEMPAYYVDGPNSAKVDMVGAISLLCQYTSSLPADIYTAYTPEWYKKTKNGKTSVVIFLPTISPLRDPIEGTPMFNTKTAKRAAALKACKLLHQCGELDEHLLPKKNEILEEDVSFLFKHYPKEKERLAGTNVNRRHHLKVVPQCIRGQIGPNKELYLHIIELTPEFQRNEYINDATMYDMYSSNLCYGFITPKAIPTLCNFPIYVSLGTLNVSIRANVRRISLSDENIINLREFSVLVFYDVLEVLRDFLVFDNSPQAESILIVPVDKNTENVDFETLEKCKTIYTIAEPSTTEKMNMEVNIDTHLKKIVTPWYRDSGNYIVTEVTQSKTAKTMFPNEEFGTYEDYFRDKHNLNLVNPLQPLLFVKSLSKKCNFFKPQGIDAKRKREQMFENLEIHLIPELVIKQDFPSSLWVQASLLPTILVRLSFLLRLEEFRAKIARETGLGKEIMPIKKPMDIDLYLLNYTPHLEKKPKEINVLVTEAKNDVVIPVPVMNANKDYAQKKLEREYPWKDVEEPKDLERNLDVTILDIEYYEKFICHRISENDTMLKNQSPKKQRQFAITYFKDYVAKPIQLLECDNTAEGPELALIYKAMTTAKANDIVNMERLETLGDSFLKLFGSLYIYLKFPNFNEGLATSLKGRLVSNKNLFYLGRTKNIGGIMRTSDLQIANWLPPGFKVPDLIKSRIDNNEMSLSSLFHLGVSNEEQITGELNQDTIDLVMREDIQEQPDDPSQQGLINDVASFFGSNYIGDKQVADCVEALIGAYFETCGIGGALKFVEWIGIIPQSEKIDELLAQPPKDPVLKQGTKLADINYHLPQADQIEEVLGYRFKNRGYLLQALTHASYTPNRITQSYEKLEFVGDAVLDFLITCHIYESCGKLDPGQLTDLRSALVNNNTFASLTVRCNFHKHLLMINPKLQGLIDIFANYIEAKNFTIDDEVLTLLTEGQDDLNLAEYIDVPKVLGDIFESIAGAVYLDSNQSLPTVWASFHRIMSKEIESFSANVPKNLVRRLYECVPNLHPSFGNTTWVDGGKVMIPLDFTLNGHPKRVYGFGSNKQLAKKAAAKLALRHLN